MAKCGHRLAAEAGGDARHRPLGQIPNRLEPRTKQTLGRFRIKLQSHHRQTPNSRNLILCGKRLIAGQ